MTYKEIVDLLAEHNHFSTAEQLRVAVDEEAKLLGEANTGYCRDPGYCLDKAREFYAADITNWIETGESMDPDVVLGMRARYAASWAFAQIINRFPSTVDRQIADLEEDKRALSVGVVHMANTVHQAYHSDGAWMDCCHGFCGSARHILETARLTPNLDEMERTP